MSLYNGTAASIIPLTPAALTSFADNAVGNLYDNVYFRGGEQDISSLTQYCAQASALKVRLGGTLPWLKSMGAGVAVNEASFMKRMLAVSQYPGGSTAVTPNVSAPVLGSASVTGLGAYDEREIFKPCSAATFLTSTCAIATDGTVTGALATLFLSGMPQESNPTGGPLIPGDLLVVDGVPYNIVFRAGQTETLTSVSPGPSVPIGASTNWFVVRADTIRAPQSFNTVYAIWQPPIGIFDFDEELGSGNFRLQLNPSSNFALSAVETKNPQTPSVPTHYRFVINDVKFYAYVEKKMMPDSSRTIDLREMSIQSKTLNNNLQFSVPPSTYAISVFIQDQLAGSSPISPPSMFKIQDNGDLYLKNIQISYASMTKPSTNWESNYESSQTNVNGALTRSAILTLQQRYRDTYEESGLDTQLAGMESVSDWLRRGPFYHFNFMRDVNNKSTEVQLNTTYSGPGTSKAPTPRMQNARCFIVAHYRNVVQITTASGLIVSVAKREV